MSRGFKTWIPAIVLLVGLAQTVGAARYMTVGAAQKRLFPAADAFDKQVVRFTSAERAAIGKQSGVKVRNLGNYVWKAKKDGKSVGLVVLDFVLGKHELIDYAVGFSPDGKVVGIEVIEYRESYGDEIRGERWRAQFLGKDAGAQLRLNADIDNISGATISCRNVTEGVRRLLATFEVVLKNRL